MKGEKA